MGLLSILKLFYRYPKKFASLVLYRFILKAHDVAIRAIKWSHNDQWMASADHDGFVKYWQPNMNNVHMFQAHKDEPIRSIRCYKVFYIGHIAFKILLYGPTSKSLLSLSAITFTILTTFYSLFTFIFTFLEYLYIKQALIFIEF